MNEYCIRYRSRLEHEQVNGMTSPVRCLCGRVYDLGTVHVIQRYADCSVWKAPCCGRTADDRTWKSLPDYVRLNVDARDEPV